MDKFPKTKDGLVRFLYEIILRRMEIRDKSRSVNSIDVVFNFDCIGFTGTPFIDNYPTFAYLRNQRNDAIPSMIDRSFYAYSSDQLSKEEFCQRFERFQGTSNNVLVEYVSSDFVRTSISNEMAILQHVFEREGKAAATAATAATSTTSTSTTSTTPSGNAVFFNVVVDLCGIFKRSTIYDVRDLVLRFFGPDHFHYIYHIGQSDSSDRVLSVNSDNDVQFDEEFYKFLVKTYGAELRQKVFFFVDNRNVIGKDVPFQLVFKKRFGVPMFSKSAVLAHDVDDFSKIWQAMGRSRTMNDTRFSIYTSSISEEEHGNNGTNNGNGTINGLQDIKAHALTQQLYVRNCDQKMAGNLSSIYQTIISLLNVTNKSFYYRDLIVNVFLLKMDGKISSKVKKHQNNLVQCVLNNPATAQIFTHILHSKFQRSPIKAVQDETLSEDVVETLLGHIVNQKFEQRELSDDLHDEFIQLLSGEQESLMEISYSKQQQKQKQKQRNRNQDSDMMDLFHERNRLHLSIKCDNYFDYAVCQNPEQDEPRMAFMMPVDIPIVTITYASMNGEGEKVINVYPTLQFLYSHHIQADYITQEVKDSLNQTFSVETFQQFLKTVVERAKINGGGGGRNESNNNTGGSNESGSSDTNESNASNESGATRKVWKTKSNGGDGNGNSNSSSSNTSNFETKDDNSSSSSSSSNRNRNDPMQQLNINIERRLVRQNPQYSILGLQEGVYIIGMKDQFNIHDLPSYPLHDQVQYIADDMGFILYSKENGSGVADVDTFGPYFIEQYILMEVLSKQEVAQNVLNYYLHHKDQLQSSLATYSETQGKGFICWRFLMNEAVKAAKAAEAAKVAKGGDGE